MALLSDALVNLSPPALQYILPSSRYCWQHLRAGRTRRKNVCAGRQLEAGCRVHQRAGLLFATSESLFLTELLVLTGSVMTSIHPPSRVRCRKPGVDTQRDISWCLRHSISRVDIMDVGTDFQLLTATDCFTYNGIIGTCNILNLT
jgi:hypothetical protein